ncbi:MAG: chromosome segregation protein ScpA [Desulfuromonadales bacterium GWC2_61_20]|nr:MAG: chromosome segregation protein ScpA [Desulfuromonadales bacterium GWC2_61_20]
MKSSSFSSVAEFSSMAYEIKLENFEGPLDLLLHLIKKHEMDIYDIPMAEVTEQYLRTIEAMKVLNLDIAGEFLVMAATLIHIKSRLLLPQADEEVEDEEEDDPRAELIRRLLEYQKYKEAGGALDALPQLERDIFVRNWPSAEMQDGAGEELEAIGIYELVEAFRELLQEHPQEVFHEVGYERLSVTERINTILFRLEGVASLGFLQLFDLRPTRPDVVVTFLALLELVKLRLVRLLQETRGGAIWLFPATASDEGATLPARSEA